MSIVICKPENLSSQERNTILALITTGEQVVINGLENRLMRAELVAFKRSEEDTIISTATLKIPSINYKESVFTDADVPNQQDYLHELGYIVTHSLHENNGYCKEVLTALLTEMDKPMFATTRKASMIHILKKYGFEQAGLIYKGDLVLLVKKK